MKDVIILYHLCYRVQREVICVDIIVRKEVIGRFKRFVESGELYKSPNCKHVKEFLEKHPEYEYLGSQDFESAWGYVFSILVAVILQAASLGLSWGLLAP